MTTSRSKAREVVTTPPLLVARDAAAGGHEMKTAFHRIRYSLEYAWHGLMYCLAMKQPAWAWCAIDEHGKFAFRQPGLWIIQQAWVFAYLGTFDEWRRMTGRTPEGER